MLVELVYEMNQNKRKIIKAWEQKGWNVEFEDEVVTDVRIMKAIKMTPIKGK